LNVAFVVVLFFWVRNTDISEITTSSDTLKSTITDKTDPVFEFIFRGKYDSAQVAVDEEVSEFILEASEARLMDLQQGKLAEQRATFRALKDYSALMVKDQAAMLDELRRIAAEKNLTVANSLGEKRSDGLATLNELHGKKFDAKFIKMMTIDHRHDLKKFEKAALSKDADIQVFATKYIPIIESHLARIKSLKNRQ
jgi:putative membrane protein